MPRNPVAEIKVMVAELEAKCQVLATRDVSSAAEMLALEREVAALTQEFGARVSELTIVANVERIDRERPRGCRPQGCVGATSMGMRTTTFRLLGGQKVKVTARYCVPIREKHRGRRRGIGRHGKWGSGCYPALVQLGIQDGATPALASEVAWHAAEAASMEVAQQALARRGVVMDRKSIRRLAYNYGRRALRLRDDRILATTTPPTTGPLAGKRVVASVDGGRLRVRSGEKRGRRRAKTRHRGYSAPWREPKVLTIYTIDERGRRDRRELPLHDGTMKDADAVFALIVGHLRLLGAADARVLVLVGDGARWIWDRIEKLVSAIGIPRERFVAIVDYYHAVEHLQKVADLRANWPASKRKDWVTRAKKHLRAGRVETVVQAIDDLCVGRRAKAMETERNYFVRNCERMRYRDFENRALPIGSGAVESAVRRLVNLRLKSNATYWLEPNAEALLHLRAVLKAGRWDELERFAFASGLSLRQAA
jgi:hypothetical protein